MIEHEYRKYHWWQFGVLLLLTITAISIPWSNNFHPVLGMLFATISLLGILFTITFLIIKLMTRKKRILEDLLQKAQSELIQCIKQNPNNYIGCSNDEIKDLINKYELPLLPVSYQNFLRAVGRGNSQKSTKLSFSYSEIPQIMQEGKAIFEELGYSDQVGRIFFFAKLDNGHKSLFLHFRIFEDGEYLEISQEKLDTYHRDPIINGLAKDLQPYGLYNHFSDFIDLSDIH